MQACISLFYNLRVYIVYTWQQYSKDEKISIEVVVISLANFRKQKEKFFDDNITVCFAIAVIMVKFAVLV